MFNVELFQRENAKTHRTSYYEMLDNQKSSLIIRRGDPFFIALSLKKNYEPNRDKIRLEVMYGKFYFFVLSTLINFQFMIKIWLRNEKGKRKALFFKIKDSIFNLNTLT